MEALSVVFSCPVVVVVFVVSFFSPDEIQTGFFPVHSGKESRRKLVDGRIAGFR